MIKNIYVMVGAASLAVVVLLAASAWVIRGHFSAQLGQSLTSLRDNERVSGQSASPVSDQTTTPASAPTPANSATSLGVNAAPNANNLGQLNTSQQSAGSSTNGSAGPQQPDPTTFGQYDKYKDGSSALFGDIQVGQGTELKDNMKAAVYYKGWLTNGQLFDASRTGSDGKLQPFIFTLGAHAVIPGWEQGMAGMRVGGSRLIIVPPAVGYGSAGQGPIPANATLVFEVQLIEVQ